MCVCVKFITNGFQNRFEELTKLKGRSNTSKFVTADLHDTHEHPQSCYRRTVVFNLSTILNGWERFKFKTFERHIRHQSFCAFLRTMLYFKLCFCFKFSISKSIFNIKYVVLCLVTSFSCYYFDTATIGIIKTLL